MKKIVLLLLALLLGGSAWFFWPSNDRYQPWRENWTGRREPGQIQLGRRDYFWTAHVLGNGRPEPSSSDRALSAELLRLTNQLRQFQGLPPGADDERHYFEGLAQAYAEIIDKNRHAHLPFDPGPWLREQKISLQTATGPGLTPAAALARWQEDPSARAALLEAKPVNMGASFYRNPDDGEITWVLLLNRNAELDKRYGYHPFEPDYRWSDEQLRETLQRLANTLYRFTPDGQIQVLLELWQGSGPYPEDARTLHLLRPEALGWRYQTLGWARGAGRLSNYFNLGLGFNPAATAYFRAHYRGQARGHLDRNDELSADIDARVDFFGSQRRLTLSLSNGRLALDNRADPRLPPRQLQLAWNEQSRRFEDDNGNSAAFFGPGAEELGGQLRLLLGTTPETPPREFYFQGAWGAVRTEK